MEATNKQSGARKPQVNLGLSEKEKSIFERVAEARGNIGISALIRLLVTDEARRLGIITQPGKDELRNLIRAIATQKPSIVESVLGEPDITEVVHPNNTPLPCIRAIYQGGKYEVVYINGVADWITINQTLAYHLNSSVIEYLGLSKKAPKFSNPATVIRWENIAGLREVSAFSNGGGRVSYFYIKCITE